MWLSRGSPLPFAGEGQGEGDRAHRRELGHEQRFLMTSASPSPQSSPVKGEEEIVVEILRQRHERGPNIDSTQGRHAP